QPARRGAEHEVVDGAYRDHDDDGGELPAERDPVTRAPELRVEEGRAEEPAEVEVDQPRDDQDPDRGPPGGPETFAEGSEELCPEGRGLDLAEHRRADESEKEHPA